MPPPTVVVPPWLNIDPTAPVDRMLSGYGLGQRAGAARTEALAQAQQQALAQQQAAELNAYRQQQQALAERQFTEGLRLDQAKAQREAQAAAQQMQGMRGLQADQEAGVDPVKSWARWAPMIFAGDPKSFAAAMQDIAPPRPPVFGTTPGPDGQTYMQSPGGGLHLLPKRYQPGDAVPEPIFKKTPDGRTYAINPLTGEPIFYGQQQLQDQRVTQAGSRQLTKLGREEANLIKANGDRSLLDESVPEEKKVIDKLDEIEAERQSIYSGTWQPGVKPESGEPLDDKEKARLLERANAAIERARKNIPAGPSQEAAINEVIARLRAMGINVTQPGAPASGGPAASATGNPYGAMRGF